MRLRVVTLNLQGLSHEWFDRRFRAVADGLAELAPDILCLQEVAIRHANAQHHQAAAIAEAIGLDSVAFSSYGPDEEGETIHQYGLAIAARWPLSQVRDRHLHDPDDDRVVLLATVEAPDGDLDVLNTHLAWRAEAAEMRRRQAHVIHDEITLNGWRTPGSRMVLAGDFNATEHEPSIRLASDGLVDAFRACRPDEPGFTWVRSNPYTDGYDSPDRRLDYVFCPEGVRVHDARVVLDRPAPVYPSDHFGVLADLEWPAAR